MRHVEVIDSHDALERLGRRFVEMVNATVVLLIEPNVLAWDDLPLVRRIVDLAHDHAVALSAVTTASIPAVVTVAMDLIGR